MLHSQTQYGDAIGQTPIFCPVCWDLREAGAVHGANKRGATLSEVRADYVEHNIKALHFAESRRAEVAGA